MNKSVNIFLFELFPFFLFQFRTCYFHGRQKSVVNKNSLMSFVESFSFFNFTTKNLSKARQNRNDKVLAFANFTSKAREKQTFYRPIFTFLPTNSILMTVNVVTKAPIIKRCLQTNVDVLRDYNLQVCWYAGSGRFIFCHQMSHLRSL